MTLENFLLACDSFYAEYFNEEFPYNPKQDKEWQCLTIEEKKALCDKWNEDVRKLDRRVKKYGYKTYYSFERMLNHPTSDKRVPQYIHRAKPKKP